MDDPAGLLAGAPDTWLEALNEAEAQVAAGQTVPADKVHALLRESLARLDSSAKTTAGPARRN